MKNTRITIEKNELVIRCSLEAEALPSSTGATLVLASTLGNARIGEKGAPEGLSVGLNVTLPNPNRPAKVAK